MATTTSTTATINATTSKRLRIGGTSRYSASLHRAESTTGEADGSGSKRDQNQGRGLRPGRHQTVPEQGVNTRRGMDVVPEDELIRIAAGRCQAGRRRVREAQRSRVLNQAFEKKEAVEAIELRPRVRQLKRIELRGQQLVEQN